MDPKVKLADIDEIVERAGRELGWTSKYTNLLATTASSMFVAHGSPDTLPIGREVAGEQIDTLRRSLESRGKSPKTALTYTSAWQRISAIVEDWDEARTHGDETKFWKGFATEYRDPRLQRRRTRKIRPELGATDHVSHELPTTTYEVRLSSGRATLTLPDRITGDDAIVLIEAITKHRQRSGPK